MKKNVFVLVGLVLLLGCQSFNKVSYGIHSSSTDLQYSGMNMTPEQIDAAVERHRQVEIYCGTYTMPWLPPTPEVPVEALNKLNPKSTKPADVAQQKKIDKALDELQQKHIEELRKHILVVKQILKNSYERYLLECRNGLKDKESKKP